VCFLTESTLSVGDFGEPFVGANDEGTVAEDGLVVIFNGTFIVDGSA
jgi:hypothetical protein